MKRNYEMERILSLEEELTVDNIDEDTERIEVITKNMKAYCHENMIMRNLRTPLTYVCRTGQVELAKILIEMGADVNKPDREGATPLINAVASSSEDIVKLLILHGVDVNMCPRHDIPPLAGAVYRNSMEIVNMLIESGADVDQRLPHSQTALEIAIIDDNLEMAKTLVEAGADVNMCNDYQDSPLIQAFHSGSNDTFHFIRKAGGMAIVGGEIKPETVIPLYEKAINKYHSDPWFPRNFAE